MISVLAESALRSLVVAFVVWTGLRALRVRNVLALKCAWVLVLAGAVIMPELIGWPALPVGFKVTVPMPQVANWWTQPKAAASVAPAADESSMAASSEPQAASWVSASPKRSLGRTTRRSWNGAGKTNERGRELAAGFTGADRSAAGLSSAAPAMGRFPAPVIRHATSSSSPSPQSMTASRIFHPMTAESLAAQMRLRAANAVDGAMAWMSGPMGLARLVYWTVCLLLVARLLFGLARALRLLYRARPVALGELPAEVRAAALGVALRTSREIHSPLTIGSAVLLPAGFAEWDREKLCIVLAHERSHIRQGDFYLQFLAGLYAAVLWFSPLGWWLKRTLSDLSETISDRAGLREAASRSSYAQILLEFAIAPRLTLEGVAMARPSGLSQRIEKLLNESLFRQAFAGGRRRALVAGALVPAALVAATALLRVQAATQPAPPPVPASPAVAVVVKPAAPAAVTAPAIPAAVAAVPDTIYVVDAPPTPPTVTTAMLSPLPPAPPAMARLVLTPHAVMMTSSQDEENTILFERTLSVSGQIELDVSTGSGNITLVHGSGSQVVIHGRIHARSSEAQEEAKRIVANPPIEQAGNVVRIGNQHEQWHHVGIDYEIEAPASASLNAATGSGNISDTGVGQSVKLTTGSGDVEATGVEGALTLMTGSGNIHVTHSGNGDAKLQTGSGDIDVREIHGALTAQTGSGNIKIGGTPTGEWRIRTGSGDVEYFAGSAGFNLDASTGSGSISSDHPMMMQGDLNRHHVSGAINGGGPTVHFETGSGDVRIH